MQRWIIATIICLAASAPTAAPADSTRETTRELRDLVTTLSPQIEALAAHTRPADWQLLRACLYYALAGRFLLARHGVDARLESGSIMYDPSTPWRHGIDPHVWLESRTHLIDFATLPRWGVVMVIPRTLVALDPVEVIPGVTRALIVNRRRDPEYFACLEAHRERFTDELRRRGLPANPAPGCRDATCGLYLPAWPRY